LGIVYIPLVSVLNNKRISFIIFSHTVRLRVFRWFDDYVVCLIGFYMLFNPFSHERWLNGAYECSSYLLHYWSKDHSCIADWGNNCCLVGNHIRIAGFMYVNVGSISSSHCALKVNLWCISDWGMKASAVCWSVVRTASDWLSHRVKFCCYIIITAALSIPVDIDSDIRCSILCLDINMGQEVLC